MITKIRVEQSFVLYAHCSVEYNGRAKSTLTPGNYLITHKNDGTLRIDGGELCTPLNYQPPGAILYKKDNRLTSIRKGEKIVITIEQVHYYQEIKDWSTNKIKLTGSESELRDYIAAHAKEILGVIPREVFTEFRTPVGVVDILIIDEDNIYHVIEVKRAKSSLATCSQLERYCYYFVNIMKNVRDYIASPDITCNALKYTNDNFQSYLKVEHSI